MAQYNSKYTGSQIDTAVARALPGGAIDKSTAEKMHALESTDYPGCYYRMANGVQEWINPPMIKDIEYRTADRFYGKPVYQIVIDTGVLGAAGVTKTISYAETGVVGFVVDFGGFDYYHKQAMLNPDLFAVGVNRTLVQITGVIDMSAAKCLVWVRYTKEAD